MPGENRSDPERKQGGSFIEWLRRNGWNLGVTLSIVLAAAAGLRFLGRLEARVEAAHEGIDRLEYRMTALTERLDDQVRAINERLESQLAELNAARNDAISEIRAAVAVEDDPIVFVNGRLTSGYDMAVDSSGGRTDWLRIDDEAMCMSYPRGQQWGAVFITVGRPTRRPRAARDLSGFRSLVVEARGQQGGESVLVGVKDNTDPDDGSETKVLLADLTADWQSYEIPLARFRTADLTRLYVVTEFVFQDAPMGVCVREIRFEL